MNGLTGRARSSKTTENGRGPLNFHTCYVHVNYYNKTPFQEIRHLPLVTTQGRHLIEEVQYYIHVYGSVRAIPTFY